MPSTLDSIYNTDGYAQIAVLSVVVLVTFYYLFVHGKSRPGKQETDQARSVATPLNKQSTTREVSQSSADTKSSAIATGAVTSMATVFLETAATDEENKQVPDNVSDVSRSSVDSDTTAVGTIDQVSNKEHEEFKATVFEKKIMVERSLESENEDTSPAEQVELAAVEDDAIPCTAEKSVVAEKVVMDHAAVMDQETECTLLEIDNTSRMMEPTAVEGTQQTVSQSVTENLQDAETDQLYMNKSTNDVCNPAANDTDEIVEHHESSTVVDTITTTKQIIETTLTNDDQVSTVETIKEETIMTTQTGKEDELVREVATEPVTEITIIAEEDMEDLTTESASEAATILEEVTTESVTETTLAVDEDKEDLTIESVSEDATVLEEVTTESATETTLAVDEDKEDLTIESVCEPATVEEETATIITCIETDNLVEADKTPSDLQDAVIVESVQQRGVESRDETVEPTEPVETKVEAVDRKVEIVEAETRLEDVCIEKETDEQEDTLATHDDQPGTNDMSSTDSKTQIDSVEPTVATQENDTPIKKEADDSSEALVESVELEGLVGNRVDQQDDALDIDAEADALVTPTDINEPVNRSIEGKATTLEDTIAMATEEQTNTHPVMMVPFTRSNPLNKPKQEMSRVERIEQQRQPYIPLYKSRCAFWPGCTNNHCKYYHPFIECRNGKACQYGKKCVFLHPKDYSAQPKGTKTKAKSKSNVKTLPTSDPVKMEPAL